MSRVRPERSLIDLEKPIGSKDRLLLFFDFHGSVLEEGTGIPGYAAESREISIFARTSLSVSIH